jgi:hypothetical protein
MKKCVELKPEELDLDYLMLINRFDLLVKTGLLPETLDRDEIFPTLKIISNKVETI